jgi:hypothetical protein
MFRDPCLHAIAKREELASRQTTSLFIALSEQRVPRETSKCLIFSCILLGDTSES